METNEKNRAPRKRTASATRRRNTDSPERQSVRAKQRREARRNKKVSAAPAVVYTEPAHFNRRKLILQLSLVLAVVLALVMGMSIFFKVEVITVTGAHVYSPWAIREASGIEEGDNLLTFSIPRAAGRIRAELPYVKSVRIGIKLPDTVNIIIEEEAVVYAIQSSDGLWWLMTSEGKIVEQTDGGTAGGYTKILGVELESPEVGKQAVAVEVAQPTAETDAEGNIVGTEPVVVTGAQRLDAAKEILQALEDNDIVGEAASVNVANIQSIELWYGTQYQVLLGDTSQMSYKIACMVSAIQSEKLKTGYGVLDVSFTTWTDQVGYTPFE